MSVLLSLACWNGLCDRCVEPGCDCPDDDLPLCPGCGIRHDPPLHYDGAGEAGTGTVGPPLEEVEVRLFGDGTTGWMCKVPGCPRLAGPYGSVETATREAARHLTSKHRGGA